MPKVSAALQSAVIASAILDVWLVVFSFELMHLSAQVQPSFQ